MNEKFLGYALEHLERELDIIDNPYIYVEENGWEVPKDNDW